MSKNNDFFWVPDMDGDGDHDLKDVFLYTSWQERLQEEERKRFPDDSEEDDDDWDNEDGGDDDYGSDDYGSDDYGDDDYDDDI